MDTEEQLKKGEERREAYRTKTERLTDKPDTASLHPPVQHMEDRSINDYTTKPNTVLDSQHSMGGL